MWLKMLWWESSCEFKFSFSFIWKTKTEIIEENDNFDTTSPWKKIRNACRIRISLIFHQFAQQKISSQWNRFWRSGVLFKPSGINSIIWQMLVGIFPTVWSVILLVRIQNCCWLCVHSAFPILDKKISLVRLLFTPDHNLVVLNW